jgi:hypothetical protein
MTACRRRFCPLARNRFVLVSGSTSHLERIIQVANDDLAGWEHYEPTRRVESLDTRDSRFAVSIRSTFSSYVSGPPVEGG